MKLVKYIIITLIVMIPSMVYAKELKITNYNSKVQGDCVLLESQGKYLLMDTCLENENNKIIEWLKENEIRNLDLYLSHYHADHIGLVQAIIDDSSINVSKVYVPSIDDIKPYVTEEYKQTNEDNWKSMNYAVQTYNTLKNNAESKKYEMIELKKGSSFEVGDAIVNIIGPTKSFKMEDFTDPNAIGHFINNLSLVALVKVDDVTYFTGGDMEKESEEALLESKADIKADIMKLNHHGSNTSNTSDLINAIKPTYAFYTFEEDDYNSNTITQDQVKTVEKWANVYSRGYNGTTSFTIKDNEIIAGAEKNVSKIEIDSIDQDNNLIHKKLFDVNKESPLYIKNYILTNAKYKYISDNIGEDVNGNKPASDHLIFTVKYEVIRITPTHNYQSGSEEEKLIKKITSYLETLDEIKIDKIKNWQIASIKYVQDLNNVKRYFVKSSYTCVDEAINCMSNGEKQNDGSYNWNFYVLDDEVIKLSTTKDTTETLIEEKEQESDDELEEGTVENPNTGAFMNAAVCALSLILLVAIGFVIRKKVLFRLR